MTPNCISVLAPRRGLFTKLLLGLAAIGIAVSSADAARLTLALQRTSMDQSTWNAIKNTYATYLNQYQHLWASYNVWNFSVDVQADAINFNYDLPYSYFSTFNNFWGGYLSTLNTTLASIGLAFNITWDEGSINALNELSTNYQGFTEIQGGYGWAPALGYFYAQFYPYMYIFGTNDVEWVYAWSAGGSFYYYVWGRGWVWSHDGSFNHLVDL